MAKTCGNCGHRCPHHTWPNTLGCKASKYEEANTTETEGCHMWFNPEEELDPEDLEETA